MPTMNRLLGRIRLHLLVTVSAGLIALSSTSWAVSYTFTQIDVPGASLTRAQGINDAGQIVGTFSNSPGVEHGFLDTGGIFTQIDVPFAGTLNTFPSGINNAGRIVGEF